MAIQIKEFPKQWDSQCVPSVGIALNSAILEGFFEHPSSVSAPSKSVWLIDLPTYPKGMVTLSLYAVAAAFDADFSLKVMDLNFVHLDAALKSRNAHPPILCGLKVSAQNRSHAMSTSRKLKQAFPRTHILWGGELPTLLPEDCLQHCDSIVCGAFEPIASQLCEDLRLGSLKQRYEGERMKALDTQAPRLDLMPHPERYVRFMGLPMESSRGCTYKCTFCMVHTMQPHYLMKTDVQLLEELKQYEGHFLNLIDYNFGLEESHVLRVAAAIKESGVLGWMGEMCVESLDNERVLKALSESRCRMVYCGLEAIDELGLKSINKSRTNLIANYERIIAKAQRYGIQVAAGMIIGLEGATKEQFERMRRFFQEQGILYTKLTFLTYNPGTKVKQSMQRKGVYLSDTVEHYDGQHLTFLAEGVQQSTLYEGCRDFIQRFYSLRAIIRRSKAPTRGWAARLEFILFNLCYREVYLQWLDQDIFQDEAGFQAMLTAPFQPSWRLRWADRWLHRVRKWRFRHEKV